MCFKNFSLGLKKTPNKQTTKPSKKTPT